MAPTIGRVALDNGFHGSIPGDWVAPPPQNIQGKAPLLPGSCRQHIFAWAGMPGNDTYSLQIFSGCVKKNRSTKNVKQGKNEAPKASCLCPVSL